MTRKGSDEGTGDASRREFFRQFGRESLRNAGAVAGAAAELRRAGNIAARDLFDAGEPSRSTGAAAPESEASVDAGFSSAYRLGDGAVLVLDQRQLPGRMSMLSVVEPSEVSSAIRSGAINGGPVLGEVAAYALALVAERTSGLDSRARSQAMSAAGNTLRTPRSDVHALRAAVDRMMEAYDQESEMGTDGIAVTEFVRAEADSIALAAQAAHSAVGRVGAEHVLRAGSDSAPPDDSTLNLLMHGDMGPLTSGLVGTGTAVINSLVGSGRAVHVWVTEAAPSTEGARVAALQLTQMDVPHTVIADTAVAWLLASRSVDATLLRGDTVVANGDTLALIGSLNVATLATAADVPVLVIAPTTSFDEEAADARGLVLDLRSPAESFAATGAAGSPRPAVFGVRLSPTVDVVPRGLISGYVTEAGVRPGGRN